MSVVGSLNLFNYPKSFSPLIPQKPWKSKLN